MHTFPCPHRKEQFLVLRDESRDERLQGEGECGAAEPSQGRQYPPQADPQMKQIAQSNKTEAFI